MDTEQLRSEKQPLAGSIEQYVSKIKGLPFSLCGYSISDDKVNTNTKNVFFVADYTDLSIILWRLYGDQIKLQNCHAMHCEK